MDSFLNIQSLLNFVFLQNFKKLNFLIFTKLNLNAYAAFKYIAINHLAKFGIYGLFHQHNHDPWTKAYGY